MSRLKHPSPALVISIAALAVAVVVPAVAQVATTALSKKEKRVVRKIARLQANKQINRRASEFTPAGEVHSPARLVLNDPTPGDSDYGSADLLAAGSFTVFVRCADNFGGGSGPDLAQVFLFGPNGSSFAGGGTEGSDFNLESSDSVGVAEGNSVTPLTGGHVTAVAPSGQVITAHATAEVGDSAGDCVFGATAIGP